MKSFTNLTAQVAPGAAIGHVCREAQALADDTKVVVKFTFNGVTCLARPGGDAVRLAERQREEMAKPKIAESL